ncbi:MAG: hypothetical protein Q7U60_11950 [Candidatus Methanoperedens sp.]|nr:hypothetical protein [Candidatus Methanoperedens sp.]
MLETPQERVKLLKAGITGKTIERLYIAYNNFKIVRSPVLVEPVEFIQASKSYPLISEACAKA